MPGLQSASNGFRRTRSDNRHLPDDFDEVQFLNKVLLPVIAIFCSLIALKLQQAEASPFDTHPGVMPTFVVAMFVCVMASLAEATLPARNSNYSEIRGKISLLSGVLALSLLLLVLVPWFGVMTLVIWFAFFVNATYDVYQKHYGLLRDAVVRVLAFLNRQRGPGPGLPRQQNQFPAHIA